MTPVIVWVVLFILNQPSFSLFVLLFIDDREGHRLMPLHFADETFFSLVLVELASECLRFWLVNMVLEILGCQYGAGVDRALSATLYHYA